MLDIAIACLVIGLPSVLALIVIEGASLPTWRTREQELGATGMCPEVRSPRRDTANLSHIVLETPTRPVGATGGSDVTVPDAPLTGAPQLVAPPAIQHT